MNDTNKSFLKQYSDKAVQGALVDLLIEGGYLNEQDLKEKIVEWQNRINQEHPPEKENATIISPKVPPPSIYSTRKMLIVDDVSPVRQMIRKAVFSLGIQNVAEAENGKEALNVFEMFSPDLVLLDIEMKGMNGIEVLKKIREQSSVPVIIMTGNPHKQYVQEAVTHGMTDFLVKPIDVNRLHEVISKALQNAS